MADIQNLIKVLTEEISTVNNVSDIAFLTRIIERLNTGYFVTVTNFSELPDPTNLKLGLLYYVVNDKLMYYVSSNSGGTKYWETINTVYNANIYGFGNNSQAQIGDGTVVAKSSPVSLVGGSLWTKISVGATNSEFSLAIKNDKTLWSWGRNNSGQLGTGNKTNSSSPISVIGGFTDWCQVSSGSEFAAAVRINGTLWTWGQNNCGQLGDGTTVDKSSPISVVGGFTDWCQVSSGRRSTAAVRSNGTLWAWGANSNPDGGEFMVGDGTSCDRSSPVSVVGGFTDWCQVSMGRIHASAVRTNGTIWAWGATADGSSLGDNTIEKRCSPVIVSGGFTDWCQVSVGNKHTVAVRTNGTVWAWGQGECGQLGTGSLTNRQSPVSVVGGFTDWCQVSAGACHTAAVRTNGTLWTWGENTCGKLGNEATAARNSPVSVVGGITTWCSVLAGDSHTLAISTRNI